MLQSTVNGPAVYQRAWAGAFFGLKTMAGPVSPRPVFGKSLDTVHFSGASKDSEKTPVRRAFKLLLPMLMLAPSLGPSTPKVLAEEPVAVQQATQETPSLDALEKQLADNAEKLNALKNLLEAQQKQLDAFDTLTQKIQATTTYEAFVKSKHQAIQKAQAAQFYVSYPFQKTAKDKNGKETSEIVTRNVQGWIAKDADGKLALLTSASALKETHQRTKDTAFELTFGDTRIKVKVAQNLPDGLSGESSEFDIALLSVPGDAAMAEKMKDVALPMENYIGKRIDAGTETLTVGGQFGMLRYATQGIVSEHDLDGVRKHGSTEAQFPAIWTDAGTNEGGFGSPLLGYNWEAKRWDVIGMTSNKRNDLMSVAVPMEEIQSFLFKRGYSTANPQDEKEMAIVNKLHQRDVKAPVGKK